MAAPPLVEVDVKIGEQVAEAIWKDPILRPTGILWYYDEDASRWRLLIASEDARHRGPQAAYLRVRKLIKKAGLLDRLPLERIVVTDPSSFLLQSVGSEIQTPGNELAGLMFVDCTFQNLFVPGLYVYHLNNTFTNDAGMKAKAAPQEHASHK